MKFLIAILLSTVMFASLHHKSAIVYYGENISYPMVGIHDYIIVQPSHINTYTHGFKIYKDKMYAYVSIGEIDATTPEYKKVKKEWILAKNEAWNSEVLDLKNREYIDFIFQTMIEPQMKRGFKNFFFDTLDSYQLASKTKKELLANEKALADFINEFHKRYPNSKLVINRGFEVIEAVHDSIEAVLFESYFQGIGGEKLAYKEVSKSDRVWLDIHIKKIQTFGLDIICVDYLSEKSMHSAKKIAKKIAKKNMIPYIGNRKLTIYGVSSKNAIKREVFTLIDEKRLDRTLLEAHQHGGLVLEYMGYVQKLYDINKGLPKLHKMKHYAGVIIWLQDYYKDPIKLIKWVKKLSKANIKVVFVSNFGFNVSGDILKPLQISVEKKVKRKKKILYKSDIMGYEIEPSLSLSTMQITSKNSEALLVYENRDGTTTTPAAYTSWGGYAVGKAFMVDINKDNIWVVNPFTFFKKALGLKTLIVPDVTTENGKRLLFSHVDGDGIMNRVEGDFGYYSGDVILNDILKVYKIPHSVSVIGAEISPQGLYPKISNELLAISREMYSLENVEPATHTFTHPFFWNKIQNGNLDEKYRLKPKNYEFSLEKELSKTLEYINQELHPKREAKEVFWSGDCAPQIDALEYVYKHNILNINGGDTIITKTTPWLSGIAPLGIQRGPYLQIYTGAQNENVFTNDWLGPFWGFKRVTQTFALTNSPRRFKPIDIYYHLYSGSKQASLKALKYVFDWAVKQDVMPIFTSEYIPKVMDYYTASMAEENNEWLITGLHDLKTIRIEKKDVSVDFENSPFVIGLKHFENHTYVSLVENKEQFISLESDSKQNDINYLISANAKVVGYEKNTSSKKISFEGYVDLKLHFYLREGCNINSSPESVQRIIQEDATLELNYKDVKKATVTIVCQ